MANSPSRIRPPALLPSRTCTWKTIDAVAIDLDIFLPSANNGGNHPIMLFIHGGGWIFLSLGFVVVSINYRLLPETPFLGQLEDIRDIESWLKNDLATELQEASLTVATDRIVVVGGSAGAHLALLTPKIWSSPPVAILSMYGPTDMHRVPYLSRGRLSAFESMPVDPEILAAATNYSHPPSDTGCPPSSTGFSTPRSLINLSMFREGTTTEFLLRGLLKDEEGKLQMPARGCATSEEIDQISPLQICQSTRYPPVYQIIGTADDIFDTYHVTDFHQALVAQGIRCESVLVPGIGHAFDIYEKVGDDVHTKILTPGVEWVAAFANVPHAQLQTEHSIESSPERPIYRCCC